MSNTHHESSTIDVPGEPRYRNSQYFQADRLRYSEAANDLRAMKNLMTALAEALTSKSEAGLIRQPAFVSVPSETRGQRP